MKTKKLYYPHARLLVNQKEKNQFIENFQKAKYTDNFLSYAPAIFAASTVNKQSGLVGWNSLSFN